jgi:predicted permease
MVGLLLVIQAAMPPAALLSVISKNISAEDRVTSQGIFYGHLVAIVTVPLILLFFQMTLGTFAPVIAPAAVAAPVSPGAW